MVTQKVILIPTVLGISIGTRKLGMALMQKGQLLDSKVIAFKGKWSDQKLLHILQTIGALVSTLTADAIALKVPGSAYHRHSDGLPALIAAIQQYCNTYSIPMQVYTITELKEYLLPEGRQNKKALVAFIGEKYPDLYGMYKKEFSNRNRYYTRMFEAIVAAELFSREHHYL